MKKTLMILVAVLALVFSFAIAEDACQHNWVITLKSDATCTSPAKYSEDCSICNAHSQIIERGSAKGHSYKTVETAATCTTPGTITTTCANCDYSDTKTTAALGHKNVRSLKSAGNCEVKAVYVDKCSVCGATTEVTGDYGDHNWAVKITEATCTAKKTFTEYCTICNDVDQTWYEGDTKAHDWHIVDVAATCTTKAMRKEVCSVCKGVNQEWEIGPALGHKEVVIAGKAATCTETGLTDGSKCSVCNTVLKAQEVIPALGHKEVVVPGKAATCTETGLTDGSKCSVCGTVLKAQEVIPALGHTAVVVPGKAATCLEAGLTDGSKCSVCGVELLAQEVIPALGHDYKKVRVVEPTETKRGFTEYACERCDDWYRARYVAALGYVAEAEAEYAYGAIVTDLDDVEMPYTAEVDAETARVTITATANEDGTIELRELHISLALVEQWKTEQITEVAFVVGDAEIVVPFAVLETELMEEVKATFPETLTGYIVTLDPAAVNDAGTVGCLVKVDLTADVASEEKVVAVDGIEMEVTDVITGMNLTYADAAFSVVGGGIYTA